MRLHRKTISNINSKIISKRMSLENEAYIPDNSIEEVNMHEFGDTKITEENESANPVPESFTLKRIIMDLFKALNPIEKNFSDQKWYSKIIQILKFPIIFLSISGYFGFIVSVSWIYLMSSELVNIILMLSIVSQLSQEILGLTVMAWCNNMGDFIADTSVARQGFSQMGASAAIAAPMFTMLIGFGTAFFIATLQGKQINISMDIIKGLLVVMIAASLITTFVTLFINKFHAKRIHGIILIVLYFVFLIAVILFDLNVFHLKL
uniref:Sodium/calcium exchanger membrane region domain-containing protein n=1 Tax=Panagrolaimus sp. PS1159 TaxID=55785 RepID=A0AC35FD63_9BILA